MEDDWATAFGSHYVELVRACTLLSGNQALAEDAVVNAFARVYGGSARRRRALYNPGAYLRVAAVNETRRMSRRDDRRSRREARFGTAPPASELVPGTAVEERDRLRRALAALAYKQRAVVVLRHVLDLPEADVAGVLGIPIGSVKSLNHRGLAALRQALSPNEQEES